MNPSATFGRPQRLTAAEDFRQALAVRPLCRGHYLSAHVRRTQAGWRLGLTVPKRYEKSSVRRNALKRVVRELFRQARAKLESRFPGHDIVVRLGAPIPAAELRTFKQACRLDTALLLGRLAERLDEALSK